MRFILLIIFILILYYFIYNDKNIENLFENFTSLYKCPKLKMGNMYDSVLEICKIDRISDQKKSDIYMPCGYNNIESELKNIKIYNKNQKIYGINGCDNIVSKNGLWNLIEKRYGRKKASLLMPESYLYDDNKDLALFKKNYRSEDIYLLKKNIQRKEGILLIDNYNDAISNKGKGYRVIQKYVHDLFLIGKRKVNLRLYLLIHCKEGITKCYLHKLGKCIYTNKDYDDNSKIILDNEIHLTSLNLDKIVYKSRPETLNDLKQFLTKPKYDKLMTNIKKNLTMVMKAVKYKLCKLDPLTNNLCFQLFGIDYLFDNDMHPYLLEMNKGPDMSSKSEIDTKTKQTVLIDVFKNCDIVTNTNFNSGFNKLNC